MKLTGTRKDQGVEVPNCQHAKGIGERPIGGAGRPTSVAILRDLFIVVQARYMLLQGCCFGEFAKITGRPAWFRPLGTTFYRNSFEFLGNVEFTLLV